MQEYRWLLPFTHGVDYRAITIAVRLAEAQGATLVPVSLIASVYERRSQGVRFEHIQQSKDFQEVVRSLSERFQVAIEGHEVFTAHVINCISMLIQDLRCDALVVVSKEQQGVLLSTDELRSLVIRPPASLILVRMTEERKGWGVPQVGKRLWSWYKHIWRHEGESREELSHPVVMEVASLREAEKRSSG